MPPNIGAFDLIGGQCEGDQAGPIDIAGVDPALAGGQQDGDRFVERDRVAERDRLLPRGLRMETVLEVRQHRLREDCRIGQISSPERYRTCLEWRITLPHEPGGADDQFILDTAQVQLPRSVA